MTINIKGDHIVRGSANGQGRITFPIPLSFSDSFMKISAELEGFQSHVEEIYVSRGIAQKNIYLQQAITISDEIGSTDDHSSVLAKIIQNRTALPVDVMVLIDNSCSMFAQGTEGCETASQHGNDPEQWRIKGLSVFISQLGLGGPNEDKYRMGVFDLGVPEPVVISSFRELSDNRREIIKSIQNPKPKTATYIIPALKEALQQFSMSSGFDNRRMIVLLTDGYPYPASNQEPIEIENIIAQHSDVMFYNIIISHTGRSTSESVDYLRFWQKLPSRHPHVNTIVIKESDDALEVFNRIVYYLQGSNTLVDFISIPPRLPKQIFIEKDTRKIILTSIQKKQGVPATITVLDPDENPVIIGEPGVSIFSEPDFQSETISVEFPRIRDELKGRNWTIRSDNLEEIMVSRVSSFRIIPIAPEYNLTSDINTFVLVRDQKIKDDLVLRFYIEDNSGERSRDKQVIRGEIILLNGDVKTLLNPIDIEPNDLGEYAVQVFNNQNIQLLPDAISRVRVSLFIQGTSSGSLDTDFPLAINYIINVFRPGTEVPAEFDINHPWINSRWALVFVLFFIASSTYHLIIGFLTRKYVSSP